MDPVDKPSARRRTSSSPSQHRLPLRAQRLPGLTALLLLLTASVVQTGPVIRSRRMIREIYVDNSAATVPENAAEVSSSSSANATASDMCLYDGSYVERSSIACEKKHGCRAIQKTGECCPDYQCECQRETKTYANGEKVFDPNTPCRSCYCQGGEITCSEVSCYKRNDCDPKYIPGRCCPEYDNCPPLENFKITESSTTNTKDAVSGSDEEKRAEETNEVKGNYAAEAEDLLAGGLQKQPGPGQPSSTVAAAVTTTTTASAITHENPLGIKIKEITKPEEIRLTDNRPSAEEQQMQQQQQLAMAAAGRNTTPEPSTSQSEELVNLEHLDVNVPDDDGENGTKIVRHTDGDGVRSEEDDGERKEQSASGESLKVVSASSENRLESSESSTATGAVSPSTLSESDEWLDVKEVADSSSGWSSSAAPTFSPPSSTQAPSAPSTSGPPQEQEESVSESNMKLSKQQENALPAVVQIGDKLVIVDHNQPKPITVIHVEEVEGLQRGEDDTVYDQEAYTERSHHHTSESGRESSKKLKMHHSTEQEQETLSTQADSSGSYETVYHPGSSEQLSGPVSSEEIFETQLYTEGPEASAPTGAERNDTQAQQGEPLSVSREDFLHMDPAQEPAKLQQDEDHTMTASGAGAISSSYSSTEEGSTTMSDMSAAFSLEASGDEMIYDTHFYTEGPNTSSEEVREQSSTTAAGAEETSTAGAITYVPRHPPAVSDDLTPQTYIEDNEPELIHPGFQQIPEDFSLPQLDQPAMEMGDMMDHQPALKHVPEKQEKILSQVLALKANGSVSTARPEDASTTEGQEETSNSPSWLKEDPKPQLRSPGEPLLIPEWERKNGTNSSSSEEDLDLTSSGAGAVGGDYHVLKMGSEEYVDAGGEGSGSGALPTTSAPSSKVEEARSKEENEDDDDDGKPGAAEMATLSGSSKSLLDIDSPASANATDGQGSDTVNHNPKNDVESLKYDENENNATADEAIPKKVQELESNEGGVQAPTLTSV
uniref:VWFC domain-containing protein n=1 Tax=Anopheles atroparvus TaxID=41427 RepID=A0AAG5D960_ANOAO